MTTTKLYAAYGSNLNLRQMAVRCPDAVPVSTAVLEGWQLTFRGVATLERCEGSRTPVGIWGLTDQCEVVLDRYEGYPRLYRKEMIEVLVKGKMQPVMLYLMNEGMPSMPSKWYLDAIAQGYEDVGLDTKYLDGALQHTKKMIEGVRK